MIGRKNNFMSKKKTIIYGNGAMAKVLYDYMKSSFDIVAFCVDKICIKEKTFCNLPLIDFENIENFFDIKKHNMINSVGFIDMNDLRKNKINEAKKKGYEIISYIDKTVKIRDNVFIDKGCIILDFVSIHPGAKIGEGTFISSNVNIGHDCIIGKYNWINSGVSIAGNTTIGDSCFLGVNSSIGNDVKIGNQNFIAANAHVSKNTLDNQTYLTQNAKLIKLKSKNFIKFANIFRGN